MSVIVAGRWHGAIYMGGDSGVTYGSYLTICEPKVVKMGDVLLGVVGDAIAQSVAVSVQTKMESADVGRFSRKFAAMLPLKTDASILYAFDDKFYIIDSKFAPDRILTDWDTIGSGAEVARGAMGMVSTPMPRRILKALEVVGRFRNDVCGPYYLLDTR